MNKNKHFDWANEDRAQYYAALLLSPWLQKADLVWGNLSLKHMVKLPWKHV